MAEPVPKAKPCATVDAKPLRRPPPPPPPAGWVLGLRWVRASEGGASYLVAISFFLVHALGWCWAGAVCWLLRGAGTDAGLSISICGRWVMGKGCASVNKSNNNNSNNNMQQAE